MVRFYPCRSSLFATTYSHAIMSATAYIIGAALGNLEPRSYGDGMTHRAPTDKTSRMPSSSDRRAIIPINTERPNVTAIWQVPSERTSI